MFTALSLAAMSSTRTYAPMSVEGSGRPRLDKTKLCIVILIVCLVLAVVAIIGLGVGLGVMAVKLGDMEECDQPSTVCTTDSCNELSSLIMSRMDQSIDPCEDFYNFSCGAYEQAARLQGIQFE